MIPHLGRHINALSLLVIPEDYRKKSLPTVVQPYCEKAAVGICEKEAKLINLYMHAV